MEIREIRYVDLEIRYEQEWSLPPQRRDKRGGGVRLQQPDGRYALDMERPWDRHLAEKLYERVSAEHTPGFPLIPMTSPRLIRSLTS